LSYFCPLCNFFKYSSFFFLFLVRKHSKNSRKFSNSE
jgi:CRISPR-associated protein Cas8b1/Cst1 subtype I-B